VGVLKCTVDHILQEFFTLFLTKFRTYKIASPPQTKMTSKDDMKGLVSLNFLRPWSWVTPKAKRIKDLGLTLSVGKRNTVCEESNAQSSIGPALTCGVKSYRLDCVILYLNFDINSHREKIGPWTHLSDKFMKEKGYRYLVFPVKISFYKEKGGPCTTPTPF
jgi:hypothetical protein